MAPRTPNAPAAPRYWARRPIGYAGQELDRGQVIQLAGAPNDERLIRLGYLQQVEPNDEPVTCAICGAEFIGGTMRTAHGDARHRARTRTPEEEEAAADREERMLDQVAPLYLENTRASAG